MKYTSVFLAFLLTLSSCGSLLDGLASMYGGNSGGTGYNPYANFWNNTSTSTTAMPAALDPANAVNAAAASINNNMQNQIKDYWKNVDPATFDQTVPVQSGGAVGGSIGGGTISGSSGSYGSGSSSSSSRQHNQCNGTGKCNSCNGTGSIWRGYGQTGKTQCPNCHGSGRCSGCNGTGRR